MISRSELKYFICTFFGHPVGRKRNNYFGSLLELCAAIHQNNIFRQLLLSLRPHHDSKGYYRSSFSYLICNKYLPNLNLIRHKLT